MNFFIPWRRFSVLATCLALAACGSTGSDRSGEPDQGESSFNSPPALSGAPAAVAMVGQEYLFEPSAYDADGDTLTFGIINRPDWATFSPTTGRLRGTPTAAAQPSYAEIQISVTDGRETVSLPAFNLTVQPGQQTPGNSPPTISGTPTTSVVAGNTYDFAPVGSDPDGQVLAYSIVNRPTWAQFDSVTGRLSGTPAANQVGVFSAITISVSDGTAQATLPAFDITVTGGTAPGTGNRAPTISGTPAAAVTTAQAYVFRPTASDPDGQSLTFTIANAPAWASFNGATGELSGTPGSAHVGQTTGIVISVSDGQASASLPAFAITVLAANSPPRISGTPPTSVAVGQSYSFTPTASDSDGGQTLTFAIANRPSWAAFNTATGRLSGTPAAANAGIYSNVVISVTDGAATAALPPFTLTVAAANRAPVISGAPTTSVTAGQAYGFTPTASDPDSGQTLTFSIANRPSWATFSTATGRLSGTPTASQVGTYSGIVITVTDGTLSASLPAFSITVADVQTGSATLSWTPPTLNEDGTAITNLRGYRVYYGTSSSNLNTVLDIPNSGTTRAVVENLSPATWYFALKAYNTSNVESSFSNIASKTIQ